MLKNKAKIAPPGRKDFALRARDGSWMKDFALVMRAPRTKILFFTSKYGFFKLNNTIFESDRCQVGSSDNVYHIKLNWQLAI